MVMSCAGLHRAVNRCPETGVCCKCYYQLLALCGLEGTHWQWFLELSPMWAAVFTALGSPGAIEQEALEVLRGQHGRGGWLPVGMEPKDGGEALAGTQAGSAWASNLASQISQYHLPVLCTFIFCQK